MVFGVIFGASMGVIAGLRHGRWTDALIEGVIAGAVYGAVMGVVMHRRFGRYREAVGSVPLRDVRRALREARRGRVPEAPEARRAAYRLLTTQLGQQHRLRHWGAAVLVLFMGLTAFVAITDSPWWWLAEILWIAAITAHYLAPRRLDRRLELLRD